ncbi:MAG: putative rRNA maturation factor [Halieaceae bacterium]|jgi:probable rRNA maturation factor
MNLTVDIQSASTEPVPEQGDIRSWINTALSHCEPHKEEAEVSVRLVDEAEMAELNSSYRNTYGTTNVLSFPADLPEDINVPMLGDIVICAPVVRGEAQIQGKTLTAHWAHMTVHGTLHLLGYDHIIDKEALVMETLETEILEILNYPCPYAGYPSQEH